MAKSIDEVKKLLHPDYDNLSAEEQYWAWDDFTFIEGHFNEISISISNMSSRINSDEIDESGVVKDAFKYAKVKHYEKMLYPTVEDIDRDFTGYMDTVDFLLENFDEIDPIAKKRLAESERFGKWGTPKEILKGIMAELKEKQSSKDGQTQNISPEQVLENALKSDAKNQDVSLADQTKAKIQTKDENGKEGVGLDDEQ